MALALSACGLLSFDREQKIPAQTVPAARGALTYTMVTEIGKQDTGPASAGHLKMASLSVAPHESPEGNFDFLDSVHVTIDAPGQPTREIASLDPIPKGLVVLELEVDGSVDLLPYVSSGAKITTVAKGRYPSAPVVFDGTVTIHIRV